MFENEHTIRLTYDELKSCEGFENIKEGEAEQLIDVVLLFSMLTYKAFSKMIGNEN